MLVYLCTNVITKKHYVGITIGTLKNRIRSHKRCALILNSPNYFYRAIRKYGWENFNWEILDESANTHSMLLDMEIAYIEQYDSFCSGYNMTRGGRGCSGFHHGVTSKNEISKSLKGIPKGEMSKEHRENLLNANQARSGKTYEELYGETKAAQLKDNISNKTMRFHSTNEKHREWLSSSYDDKFGIRAQAIKTKMSNSHKKNLVNGKRVDLTDEGRESLSTKKLKENNPQYIKIEESVQSLITDAVLNRGIAVSKMSKETGYSIHVIKRFLKETSHVN